MPPRENEDLCLLDTEDDPGFRRVEQASKLAGPSELAAPVVAVGEVAEPDPVPTPGGLLQYILCMVVNFIVVSLGINWFLGFFGLALKPLDELDIPEESALLKFKEKKRKLEEMDKLSGEDEGQVKLTKRSKSGEVLVQEKDAAETEDEELDIIEKVVGGEDKAKAIAEFQSRLWNMKPDFNFSNNTEQQSQAGATSEVKMDLVEVEKTCITRVEEERKDVVVKKVITPSESFDNVLDMSEDTSETPSGDIFDGDVDVEDEIIIDAGDEDKECQEEKKVETTAATNVGLLSDQQLVLNVNDEAGDLETKPTERTDKTECDDATNGQKTEGNNLSESQKDAEEGQISEEESDANGLDTESASSKVDYPVLVKPEYAVQAKPDYAIQEKPDYAIQEKPDYVIQEKPDYAIQEKPDYTIQEKHDYAIQEKPDYAIQEKPDYAIQEKPDYVIQEKPDYAIQEKPDYAIQEKPDYAIQEKPDYAIQEKPNYAIQVKPDFQVIEKPIYQVLKKPDHPLREMEKPDCQELEKPDSTLLDAMVEEQDDHLLAAEMDDSVSEELDQKTRPFLDGQLENSEANMTPIKNVEEQTGKEDSVTVDNEKYEIFQKESGDNTIEFVGEEKTVTEAGHMLEKCNDIVSQLCTAEEKTDVDTFDAHGDEKEENPGEVCEESISVDVEEKRSEAVENEGRRGSVGSKGRGGGNKSGSKKKKKRKIL